MLHPLINFIVTKKLIECLQEMFTESLCYKMQNNFMALVALKKIPSLHFSVNIIQLSK